MIAGKLSSNDDPSSHSHELFGSRRRYTPPENLSSEEKSEAGQTFASPFSPDPSWGAREAILRLTSTLAIPSRRYEYDLSLRYGTNHAWEATLKKASELRFVEGQGGQIGIWMLGGPEAEGGEAD